MAQSKKPKGTIKRESDPTRWAHLIFALGGFMAFWVLSHAVEDIWSMVWSSWPQLQRPDETTSTLIAAAISIGGTLYAWRKERWFKFCTEVIVEISQVTWPTKAETRQATIVVIVMTLVCSCLLWAMDQSWSRITNWLYGI